MSDSALFDFFKGIVDSEEGPIVICSLDYRVIYENPAALKYYSSVSPMTGKLLSTYMDEEMMSKVTMSVEWFKEDKKNNKVFVTTKPIIWICISLLSEALTMNSSASTAAGRTGPPIRARNSISTDRR